MRRLSALGSRLVAISIVSLSATVFLAACSPTTKPAEVPKVNCVATQSYADATFWYPNWKPNEIRFAGYGGYVCDQNVMLTIQNITPEPTTLSATAFYISTEGAENLVGLVNSEADLSKMGVELIPVQGAASIKAGTKFQIVASIVGEANVLKDKGIQKQVIRMQMDSETGGGKAQITAHSNIGTK
jgi:hypothetical protein